MNNNVSPAEAAYGCTRCLFPLIAACSTRKIRFDNKIHLQKYLLKKFPLFHLPDLPSRKIHRENIRRLVKPRLKLLLGNRLSTYELMRFRNRTRP